LTFEFGSRLSILGNWAFESCESLQSIFIPSSVEWIELGCFDQCGSLVSIAVAADSKLSAEAVEHLRSICSVTSR
jgi:hypothetical protein